MVAHLLSAQNLFLQLEDGTTHGEVTDQVLRFTASMLKTAGGLEWWAGARPIWRPEFVAYMDDLMKDAPAVTETWPFFNDVD